VATSSGALWKEHRTFTLNTLREFGFGKRSLESKVIEEIEVFVHEIQSKDGAPFDMHNLLHVCISNIMCSINFGQRYDHNDKNFQFLLTKMNENFSNENMIFVATVLPFVKYIPGDPCRIKEALSNAEVVENHLRQIIREHEKTYDENNIRDYIDVFLKKMKSEKGNPSTTFDGKYMTEMLNTLTHFETTLYI
jgi:cytochrome P450 family 2 subfamily U polypeptide 1